MGFGDWFSGPKPVKDQLGRYPAWYAACEGRADDLARDLKRGVEIDHADKEGMTMLSVAAFYGRIDCLKLLLERGADPNIVNRHGNGPLWEATREASQNPPVDPPKVEPVVVDMLLAAGADPLHKNKAGKSPPGWAAWSEDLQAIYRKHGYDGEFSL